MTWNAVTLYLETDDDDPRGVESVPIEWLLQEGRVVLVSMVPLPGFVPPIIAAADRDEFLSSLDPELRVRVLEGEVHEPIWCDRCGAHHAGECPDEGLNDLDECEVDGPAPRYHTPAQAIEPGVSNRTAPTSAPSTSPPPPGR